MNEMKTEFVDYEHLEPIPRWYGYTQAVASFVAFFCLHLAVRRFAIPAVIEERKILWKWKNILVSWIHAVIVGVWVLSSFYFYPEVTQDLIAFHNLYCYGVVAFSTGYFCCDFMDIVLNSQAKAMWEVLLHHVAVLSIFLYNITACRYIGFTNVALLVEVHSISLHLRKIMQMAGVSFQNVIYRINNIINLAMFLGFRMLAITWITAGLIWQNARMSTFYISLLGATMFVMWVINLILLWRLIKSDVLRDMRKRQPNVENGRKNQQQALNGINDNNNKRNMQKVL